jgi:hypothetical protein
VAKRNLLAAIIKIRIKMYETKSQMIKSMLSDIESKLKSIWKINIVQTSKANDHIYNVNPKEVSSNQNLEPNDKKYSSNFRANNSNFSTSIGSNQHIYSAEKVNFN